MDSELKTGWMFLDATDIDPNRISLSIWETTCVRKAEEKKEPNFDERCCQINSLSCHHLSFRLIAVDHTSGCCIDIGDLWEISGGHPPKISVDAGFFLKKVLKPFFKNKYLFFPYFKKEEENYSVSGCEKCNDRVDPNTPQSSGGHWGILRYGYEYLCVKRVKE